EIWNLVFMQFNRDRAGKLAPLPKPSVDTGMGLERLAAVMQGVHSNYDTDLFQALIEAAAKIVGTDDRKSPSLNVLADHVRAAAFLITDGVLPSNEGRGYVLRRIVRRAIRHGHKLGAQETFFYKLVAPLVAEMGAAYPELARAQTTVERALAQEEERFNETLEQGLRILDEGLAAVKGGTIPGELIFKLYDTYGFPTDLTRDVAMERKLKLDMEGFEREMEAQRERARAASVFKNIEAGAISGERPTEFTGYERLRDQAEVLELTSAKTLAAVNELKAGETGNVVLDRTPFYAESGGQVGDRGELRGEQSVFVVQDTMKVGQSYVHKGFVKSGALRVGKRVSAVVGESLRRATMRNHSATHLMHKALRDVLGPHVQQKGSLVDEHRTRFDFSHHAPMTPEQIREIEERVNAQILLNQDTQARVMDMDAALAQGAMALFGEKYGDRVRVLNIGDSVELCGGTHVPHTGDIGLFKIVSEGGVAAGVRRIEAYTGEGAQQWVREMQEQINEAARLLKTDRAQLIEKVQQLQARAKGLEKELEQARAKLASGGGGGLLDQVEEVDGVRVLAAQMDGADVKALRDAVDHFKDKLAPAAIVLASVQDGKVSVIAGVTKELTTRLNAGELVNHVAGQIGGKGGGRADMAQAGGVNPAGLEAALKSVSAWVRKR
ncbi:MAG TPA: alanine--tRNA ligase, partial [Burkholderiales bacterium]